MDYSEKHLKNFFSSKNEILKILENKRIFLFLDYDGTLTPIVERPELAVMADDMRQKVQALSEKIKVSIVSGRATDDVRSKVKINNIFYAGSHGFEIVLPDGSVKINEEAARLRSVIDKAHCQLEQKLKNIKGALAEHVKYTISAHYRLVEDNELDKFKQAVKEVLDEFKELRMTSGKKVFELRPIINWDKGKAVQWILDTLKFSGKNEIAIYIGDDTTDEDAFAVLKNKGFGIVVANEVRPTHAEYIVKDTNEVKKVLEIISTL